MFKLFPEKNDFSAPWWLGQLVLCLPAILGLSTLILSFIESRHATSRQAEMVEYMVVAASGTIVALVVGTLMPRTIASGGKVVWIAPVLLFFAIVLADGRLTPSRLQSIFFTRPNESPLFVGLFTMPTWGACFYSLGMKLAEGKQGRVVRKNSVRR